MWTPAHPPHFLDSMNLLNLLPYLLVTTIALAAYLVLRRRGEGLAIEAQAESVRQGMTEPPSLHPVVDPQRCIGSGGCARACPEQALGVINGKAALVNPAACIGHGACLAACPVEAISLVFGTRTRGVDIPQVTPEFESNVPGLYIAGELGGMGLIRKAAEQGRQAMDALRRRSAGQAELDVLIVGAGPAGLSAGLSAIEHKLRYVLIEQEDSLGGSVYHYPRNKIAMTAPVKLALVGSVQMGEIAKEKLLEFWHRVVAQTGLKIHFNERMERIERQDDTFLVTTSRQQYHARSIVLAIGRRGTPRKLEVPGEEQPKVVYRLIDPEQYRGQRVLVVGGGDSALEAAIAVAQQPDTTVTLSYRGGAFNRVKERNRQLLAEQVEQGRLTVRLESQVLRIESDAVLHNTTEGELHQPNQAVIVCAGGVLPTTLLQQLGVAFATKYGTA